MSGTGMGLQIGGMAEQDISGYLASYLEEKAGEKAIDRAKPIITQAYGEAKGYQQPYYQQGTQALSTLGEMAGRPQATGSGTATAGYVTLNINGVNYKLQYQL